MTRHSASSTLPNSCDGAYSIVKAELLAHQMVYRALIPPGYHLVGAVDVLGAGYITESPLSTNDTLYKHLSNCSVSSRHIPSSIFAPSYVYKIDRQELIEVSITSMICPWSYGP